MCLAYQIPPPLCEYRFHPVRKWRFDFAWPDAKVALEVQGGIWFGGRHTRGAALIKEWEKLNTAASLGWRILYCQPSDLSTRRAGPLLEMLRTAINHTNHLHHHEDQPTNTPSM